jgi:branched-chain amino acid transport system substrate-binding protein
VVSYDRSRESPDPTGVAAGLGYVWTTDGSNWLVRLNPRTRHVDRINLRASLDGVAVGDGGVWVISGAAASIFGLDRRGRETMDPLPIASKPSAESPYPIGVVIGAGYVWVLNANTATVTAIDPVQRLVAATAHLGIQRRPVRLAAGDGAAWVADGDGTLARIDEVSPGQPPEFLQAAPALRDVAVVGKAIWVAAGAGGGGADLGTVSSAAAASPVRPLPPSICSPIYSGSGTRPRYLIAGDLALQGSGGTLAAQAGQAIQFVLDQHHFRAGRYSVGYQSCDNASAGGGYPTPAKCAANARAYASDRSVLGVIGSWTSECSEAQLPITNRAPDGPLAMVAPTNTYDGLTHRGPGTAANEPAKYYPTGTRNYVRVSAADALQGAADAIVAHGLGARRVFVLRDGEPYGDGIAADFTKAARRLGLTVVGPTLWNFPKSNRAFISKVIRARADTVFLGTFLISDTVKLIKDLRSALPPRTQLIAPDGFEPSYLVANVGEAAEGMTASVPGPPSDRLPPRGRAFFDAFVRATGNEPAPSTIAAAQATEVLLTAIGRSDGTRASVVKQLFQVRVTNGILGSFSFDHNGDTTARAVTIYRITNCAPTILKKITPPVALLH